MSPDTFFQTRETKLEGKAGWYECIIRFGSFGRFFEPILQGIGCERVVIHREIPGQIDRVRCFSAVGWALPGRAAKPFSVQYPQKRLRKRILQAPKGGGVHPSKSHLSWVKYGAISSRVMFSGHILLFLFNPNSGKTTRKVDKPASRN